MFHVVFHQHLILHKVHKLLKVCLRYNVLPVLTNNQNFLFVLGVETTTRRIFRVSEVQMDEEGEITVRATIYPCTTDGQSLIADFSDNLFTIRR